MILAIDIGNTTVALATLVEQRIRKTQRVATSSNPRTLELELGRALKGLCGSDGTVRTVVVCSVVPRALKVVEKIVRKNLNLTPLVVGRDIFVPLKNRYKDPKQVGQDRLVGAFAAQRLYGTPCIVIDLGTAITFDVVSGKGEYLGGVIVPGLRLSLESLHLKTALLPRIQVQAPKSVVGKSTKESMLSGIFYGYGSLCRGLIDLIRKEIRGNPTIVMTGGHTKLMQKFIDRKIRVVDEDLVFKGLALLVPR